MSSKKGRSGNKKNNHPRRKRRKKNLEKLWIPKNPTLRKKKVSYTIKKNSNYIPRIILNNFHKDSFFKLSISYTSFPNQPYNSQEQQASLLF